MVEFVGLIKVDILRGTNLAIRDVMSSDPYVILNLGHQVSNSKFTKVHPRAMQSLFGS